MKNRNAESNLENITFGVEFETIIPLGSVNVGGYHSGASVQNAPAFAGKYWKAERDGSIQVLTPGYQACEFVSPILKGEAGVSHLLEFTNWLAIELGAKVNSSCGFHIHVGIAGHCQNYSTAECAEFVNKLSHVASFYSTALYAQTGTLSRENGHYCAKPNAEFRSLARKAKKTKEVYTLSVSDRYTMLNLTNVPSKGTVEFRCFAGTTNPAKVLLHLFSVLTICRIASQLRCVPSWEAKVQSGQESVWNLLSRQSHRRASCKYFAEHWRAMVEVGIEMASKYDTAKAAVLPFNTHTLQHP